MITKFRVGACIGIGWWIAFVVNLCTTIPAYSFELLPWWAVPLIWIPAWAVTATLLLVACRWGEKRIRLAQETPLKRPWLIQRCKLAGGNLRYDYMGSAEFEWEDLQRRSLKRIFSKGMQTGWVTVNIGEQEVSVYMVADKDFPFADYRYYLQEIVDNTQPLQEPSYFDVAVKAQLGLEINRVYNPSMNVWFDLRNDVLWTLSEGNQQALISKLADIKRKWAIEKEKE